MDAVESVQEENIELSSAQKQALDKELDAIENNPSYLQKWDDVKGQFKKSKKRLYFCSMKVIVNSKTWKQEKAVNTFFQNLKEAVDFVNRYREGKAKAKSLQKVLQEL